MGCLALALLASSAHIRLTAAKQWEVGDGLFLFSDLLLLWGSHVAICLFPVFWPETGRFSPCLLVFPGSRCPGT
jgi:hypothetical protein